jgi:hypothetical protein
MDKLVVFEVNLILKLAEKISLFALCLKLSFLCVLLEKILDWIVKQGVSSQKKLANAT